MDLYFFGRQIYLYEWQFNLGSFSFQFFQYADLHTCSPKNALQISPTLLLLCSVHTYKPQKRIGPFFLKFRLFNSVYVYTNGNRKSCIGLLMVLSSLRCLLYVSFWAFKGLNKHMDVCNFLEKGPTLSKFQSYGNSNEKMSKLTISILRLVSIAKTCLLRMPPTKKCETIFFSLHPLNSLFYCPNIWIKEFHLTLYLLKCN